MSKALHNDAYYLIDAQKPKKDKKDRSVKKPNDHGMWPCYALFILEDRVYVSLYPFIYVGHVCKL